MPKSALSGTNASGGPAFGTSTRRIQGQRISESCWLLRALSGPVRQLVGDRRRVRFCIAEGLEGRHPNRVGRNRVIGATSAVFDLRSGRGEESLDPLDLLLGRFGQGVEVSGEAFASLDIENRVLLEERNFLLGLLAALGLVRPGERAGANDGGTVLSFLMCPPSSFACWR
jgi:hypothetical protein